MAQTEAQKAAKKRYAEKHRDRVLASKRKWNKSEKGRKVRDAWQRSEVGKAWFRAETRRLRGVVLAGYGHKCACCGEPEREFLAIDHVNGGGRQERKKIPPGIQFYSNIIKAGFPDKYRLLCHNCNMSFGLYGYCPHNVAA